MTILSVKPAYFRNLAPEEIVLSEGINLVVGKNGSGKTSLLEAIYMLTSGRSFRTRKLETIIFRNEDTRLMKHFCLDGSDNQKVLLIRRMKLVYESQRLIRR